MSTITLSSQNQAIKDQVQNLLKWDDSQFAIFQGNMGYRYLTTEFGEDDPLVTALMKHRIFWSWWINHWIRRDIIFLSRFEGSRSDILEKAYILHHNPRAVTFKPHNTLLRLSYAEMIGELIDSVAHG